MLGVVVHRSGEAAGGALQATDFSLCHLARSSCGLGLAGRCRDQDPRARCTAAGLRGWAAPASDPGPGGALASQEVTRELGFWGRWREEDEDESPDTWVLEEKGTGGLEC